MRAQAILLDLSGPQRSTSGRVEQDRIDLSARMAASTSRRQLFPGYSRIDHGPAIAMARVPQRLLESRANLGPARCRITPCSGLVRRAISCAARPSPAATCTSPRPAALAAAAVASPTANTAAWVDPSSAGTALMLVTARAATASTWGGVKGRGRTLEHRVQQHRVTHALQQPGRSGSLLLRAGHQDWRRNRQARQRPMRSGREEARRQPGADLGPGDWRQADAIGGAAMPLDLLHERPSGLATSPRNRSAHHRPPPGRRSACGRSRPAPPGTPARW